MKLLKDALNGFHVKRNSSVGFLARRRDQRLQRVLGVTDVFLHIQLIYFDMCPSQRDASRTQH